MEEALALGSWRVHIERDRKHARVRLRHVGGLLTRRFDRNTFDELRICPADVADRGDHRLSSADWHSRTGRRFHLNADMVTMVGGWSCQIRLREMRERPALLDELIDDRLVLTRVREALAGRHGLVTPSAPTRDLLRPIVCALAAETVSPERRVLHLTDRHDHELPGVLQVSLDELKAERIPATCRSLISMDMDVIVIDAELPPELRGAFDALAGSRLVVRTVELPSPGRILASLRGDGADNVWLAEHLQLVLYLDLLRTPCEVCSRVESNSTRVALPADPSAFARTLLSASLSRRVEAVGCPACCDSGFGSVQPVLDLTVIDRTIRDLLRRGEDDVAEVAMLDARQLPSLACVLASEGRLSHTEATRLGR